MSKEKRRVPKLRFPGFTEDWEQRKLSDVLVERNEQQVETREYPLMSFVQGLGVTPKGERYDRSFLVLDQSKKYKRTELGDFIYSSNNLETGSIGINKTGKAVISPVYSIFQGVTIGDSQFIGIMSLLPRFIAKMIRFRQGVVYGQWRIHETDFLDISVLIPSVDERTKITQLILSIEKIITLHQRKLNNIKLKKKALLQKLFPKNGERYPELRFPGFTDAWEQRKLDTSTTFIGDGLHGTPKYDENGTHYFINGNNLVDSKISITEETKRVSDEALSNDDRRLNSTAILMSINGTIGVLARYNNENIMLGKSVAYITPKNINRDFLFYQLQGNVIQTYFYKNLTGTTIKNLGLGTIKNTIVMSTLPEEESEIGQFFYKLDQYITLHQRKLDHLQLQKKALLQQMFV